MTEDDQEEALEDANKGNPECQDELKIGIGSGHVSQHPMMVMADEATGNEYMRAVDRKGLSPGGDNSWLVKDMRQELKTWGYPVGGKNALILKSDGEPAIVAVREALAGCHGRKNKPRAAAARRAPGQWPR